MYMYATRSEGGYLSQFSDMLEFLSHQKIFYKTCMRAVKVAMNFQNDSQKVARAIF